MKLYAELDEQFLDNLIDIHEIDVHEIIEFIQENGLNIYDVNSPIYAVLYLSYYNFANRLMDFIQENDLGEDIKNKLEDFDPEIYTNCIDSFYNSFVEEFDLTDFSDKNLKIPLQQT